MFELTQALNNGAKSLASHYSNAISINAGCELFIAFATLFPQEKKVRAFITWKEPVTSLLESELQ